MTADATPPPPLTDNAEPKYEVAGPLATDLFEIYGSLSDDELTAAQRAREFVDSEVQPVINDYWDRAEYPLHLIKRMGDLDLLRDGVRTPRRPDISRVSAGLITMELARGDGSIATAAAVQGALAMRSIEMCGSPDQKQHYLPQLASGELLGAFGLTEPAHGSDSVALETSAKQVEGGWLLSGEKKWIGHGAQGGITVVWARSDEDQQVKGFIVPQESPGYEASTIRGKLSLRAIHQAHIRLQDVFVPEEACLPHAQSFRDTAKVLFSTRLGVAWSALGEATACYEAALQYSQQRVQFGRPLASAQIIQERLARMAAELTQVQLVVLTAARREEAGSLTGAQASLAKFTSTRAARSIRTLGTS